MGGIVKLRGCEYPVDVLAAGDEDLAVGQYGRGLFVPYVGHDRAGARKRLGREREFAGRGVVEFRDYARRIIAVPKAKIDKQEAEYRNISARGPRSNRKGLRPKQEDLRKTTPVR